MEKIILLESIRSMQNVGAVMRNCDGLGFSKVIMTGYTPFPPRTDIAKTAIGAENYIDWEFYEDEKEILQQLKNEGYKIISVELDERSIDFRELSNINDEKICLVMGNELDGVTEFTRSISDYIAEIPMFGKKESLNVSVAAGIVMAACPR